MPTLFAVYNLMEKDKAVEFDQYLPNTKIPGIRGAPWCTEFNTWRIDKVLAPAVSEPEGELPSEPPHGFVDAMFFEPVSEEDDFNSCTLWESKENGDAY